MSTTTATTTRPKPEPFIIPRPETTTPPLLPPSLPTTLHQTLQATLLHETHTIPPLAAIFRTECAAANWSSLVQQRVMQVLRNGEVKTRPELERLLVREALEGAREERERRKEKWEGKGMVDDGAGKEVAKQNPQRINITFPGKAIEEGTKIVREAVETFVELEPEPEKTPPWYLD